MTAVIFALLFVVCTVSAIVVHDFDCATNGPPIPPGTTDLRLRLHGVCRADQLVFLELDNLEVVGPATVLGPLPHMNIRNWLVLRDLFFDGQDTYANMFYESELTYNLYISNVNVTRFRSQYIIVAIDETTSSYLVLDRIRAYDIPGGLVMSEVRCMSMMSCSHNATNAYEGVHVVHAKVNSFCFDSGVKDSNFTSDCHHSGGFDITPNLRTWRAFGSASSNALNLATIEATNKLRNVPNPRFDIIYESSDKTT